MFAQAENALCIGSRINYSTKLLKWLLVADDELRLPGQLHACVRRQSRPEQPPRCPASEAGEDFGSRLRGKDLQREVQVNGKCQARKKQVIEPEVSIFFKWAIPGLFFVYFRSFHTTNISQIL